MALWGNDDYVTRIAAGTISLDYDTKIVTGANGTQFGVTGYAKEGDVLRIGYKGGTGTYFGDATIATIEGPTKCTLASTEGLSGAAIASTSFWVSELPVYTTTEPTYSENSGYNDAQPEWVTVYETGSLGQTSAGSSILGIDGGTQNGSDWWQAVEGRGEGTDNPVTVLNNGANTLEFRGDPGIAYVAARFTVASGGTTVPVGKYDLPGLTTTTVGNNMLSNYQDGGNFYAITGIGNTTITVGSALASGITAGAKLKINNRNLLMLDGNVAVGIETGDRLYFQSHQGGHDKMVYGINAAGVEATAGGEFQNSAGWVGVTTYKDCQGNTRVKSEILVAMSGITTGPAGAGSTSGKGYPPA